MQEASRGAQRVPTQIDVLLKSSFSRAVGTAGACMRAEGGEWACCGRGGRGRGSGAQKAGRLQHAASQPAEQRPCCRALSVRWGQQERCAGLLRPQLLGCSQCHTMVATLTCCWAAPAAQACQLQQACLEAGQGAVQCWQQPRPAARSRGVDASPSGTRGTPGPAKAAPAPPISAGTPLQ